MAIFSLPLILGRLADAVGIHQAYVVVLLLLAMAFLLTQATARFTWLKESLQGNVP